MKGIEKLLIVGIGAFALMAFLKSRSGESLSCEDAPCVEDAPSVPEQPRVAQIIDVATVPAYSQARIDISCPFEKCEVIDNGNIIASLLKGEFWRKCYYETASYGNANCCESGSVFSADGSRVIGCKNDRMINNTGIQNIPHIFQVKEVL